MVTMQELLGAADRLAYLNSPVEARVTRDGLTVLRLALQPDLTKSQPPPSPVAPFGGIRLIVDDDLPKWRMEFRDRHGNVTDAFDLVDLSL